MVFPVIYHAWNTTSSLQRYLVYPVISQAWNKKRINFNGKWSVRHGFKRFKFNFNDRKSTMFVQGKELNTFVSNKIGLPSYFKAYKPDYNNIV